MAVLHLDAGATRLNTQRKNAWSPDRVGAKESTDSAQVPLWNVSKLCRAEPSRAEYVLVEQGHYLLVISGEHGGSHVA